MQDDYNIGFGILRSCQSYPDRIAYLDAKGASLSYRGLESFILKMAVFLRQQGVGRGSCLAIQVEDNSAHIIALAACALLGASWTGGPSMRLQLIADRLTHILHPKEHRQQPIGAAEMICLGDFKPNALAEVKADEFDGFGDPEDLARITFSSGSTGEPKAIAMTARDDWARVSYDYPDALDGQPPVCLCLFRPQSGHGAKTKIRTLLAGGVNLGSASRKLLERVKINQIVGSPSQFSQFLAILEALGSPAHFVQAQVGGGKPSARLLGILRKRFDRILIFYGATEIGDIALNTGAEAKDYDGRLQVERPGLALEIVDDAGQPVAAGIKGRLRMKSEPGIGIYLDPVLEAQKLQDGWFLSSDVGYWGPDGSLYLEGRANETQNIGGITVDLTDYDDFIEGFAGVRDGYALILPDKQGVDALCLMLNLGPGFGPADKPTAVPQAAQDLVRAMAASPDLPMPPLLVFAVENLPRTDMGKPQRYAAVALARTLRPLITTHKRPSVGRQSSTGKKSGTHQQ